MPGPLTNGADSALPATRTGPGALPGMTKREEIATRVLAAIMNRPNVYGKPEQMAKSAVDHADALIARLNL